MHGRIEVCGSDSHGGGWHLGVSLLIATHTHDHASGGRGARGGGKGDSNMLAQGFVVRSQDQLPIPNLARKFGHSRVVRDA